MTSPKVGNARPTPAIAMAVTDAGTKPSLFSNRLPHPTGAITAAPSATLVDLMARRENLLLRLSQQIRNAPLDIDTSLAVAVREVRQLFNLDRCYFLWGWATTTDAADTPPPHGVLAVTHEDKHEELASLVGECSPAQIASLWPYLTQYQVLQVTDLAQATTLEPGLQAVLRTWGMTAQLLVPIETRSGQLGAIVCGHSYPHHWQADELRLLQAITTQLAIAMDQVELHAQTRAAATAAQTHAQQLTETLENLRKTQLQLIQSEKMSSLGHLVAGIAHEINNPINFINGNLTHANSYFHALQQLIQAYQHHYPTPAPELQAYIEAIDLEFVLDDFSKLLSSMQIGTERIREIVLSLRNFSRLDEAELKPVDLHDGIDSTLLILQGQLKPKGAWGEFSSRKTMASCPRWSVMPARLIRC
ncbi:sensor histidine kinase [Trichothermofontia sp.]